VYGPTETTIIGTTWSCPIEFNGDTFPIGRPMANKKAYILDKNSHPVPLGATGEIYIGGVGVARGYLNRPELTSQMFVRDPFVDDANARMYKTGDLGRYLSDGNIVYLGRNDHQVKIRGFRIELGEIEARLSDHPLVEMATVIVMGEGSDKKLVAYVVSQPNDQLTHTLRSYLASCLPEYMVPAAYVRLDDLPLTSNGKLDRSRLPEPDGSSFANQLYESPHGEMELALATIWRELLNIDKIGRHDNFFMLGGHSLLAVRMINQIKSLMGFKINLGILFEAPTIAELVPRLLTAGNIQEDAFDVLLPIKPRGTRPPLFCIHHGFGLSWSYIGLARHVHADQPLYGLQARGFFNSSSQPAATVEGMALDYIDQIRRIQPHGPYHLLGYSFGCMVAHTMAAHLERQGESVALLAAMDSVPEFHSLSFEENQEDESEHVRIFANRLMDAIPETTKPLVARIQQTVKHLVRIAAHHSPLSCNSGMIFFRAMVQKDPTRQPISPDVWKPFVKGEIEVHDIDCDHIGMDQPGPLGEIGSVLAQRLEEIQASRQGV
jgi:thioesterase domain-containing protein